ncbi:MAG: hypothetical protein JWO86_856 [Myxococcaceae bacterium]|nr:hypothetical protein [Myxococcaceae bacterium]
MGIRSVLVLGVVAGCTASTTDPHATTEDPLVDIPVSSIRDQKETGNCWLYATTSWVESIELAALREQQHTTAVKAPPPLSISYFDYWDWFSTITSGGVTSTVAKTIREDQLDAGGSWGAAVELIARRGLVRAADFNGGAGIMKDADLTNAALDAITTSLLSGPLATKAARKDGTLVRHELDKAFGLSTVMKSALTAAFGADGSRGYDDGTATSAASILSAADLEVLAPRAGAASAIRPLSDLIGKRAAGDDPDQRTGLYAWKVASYTHHSATATRAYFKRIQRALHAGVAVPISWFLADNGDPDGIGAYKTVPAAPAGAIDSVDHETLITDYEATNVPGVGTLHAGVDATAAERTAALDDSAKIVFFRVKDSYATRVVKKKRVTMNDLYVDYLTGTVRVCPASAPTSPKCHDVVPLEDVTLPPGF